MWNWLRQLLLGRAAARHGSESDVEPDHLQSRHRESGGVSRPQQPDQASTTGPSGDTGGEPHVGRVTGADTGYEGTTGAEQRAWSGGESSGEDRDDSTGGT